MKKICLFLLVLTMSLALFAVPTSNSNTLNVKLTMPTESGSFGITNKDNLATLANGAPAGFNVDLTLLPGEDGNVKSSDAYIWWRITADSNEYTLTLTSTNGGKLKNGNNEIAYSCTLGALQNNIGINNLVETTTGNLESDISFKIQSNKVLYYGAVPINLSVAKSAIEGATVPTGEGYKDTITVTISGE